MLAFKISTLIGVLVLAGCSLTEKQVNDDFVVIAGEQIQRDENGALMLTQEQLALIKGQKDVVVFDNVMPNGGAVVTEEELQLISQDQQLFEETVEGVVSDTEVYTFLIKKGSLKQNLLRLTEKYSTKEDPISLDYGDADYYVESSHIVRAASVEELVATTLDSFPVFASIDGVTFTLKQGSLKANLDRLSEKYSTNESPISVNYEGGDLYVPQTEFLRADSLEELVALILDPYPLFGAIE